MSSRATKRTAQFDRYELLEKVGEGGYGTVYKARHRFLEQIVALKVLPPALRADAEAMARFEREVQALRRLDHPHVVNVQDAGIEERSGAPYLAMTFVEGETLHHHIAQDAPLPIDEVVRLGWQIASALAHVHTSDREEPLVHRDVKPSNIILTPDGRAVLTDFGIAFSASLPRISRDVIGTPEFMSPEQADGKLLDGRSDVYSLGVVLYEALTGRLPFEAESESPTALARLLSQILYDEAPPVSTVRADVPAWLGAVVARCLAKDPDDRYTAAELAEALRTGDPDPVLDDEAAVAPVAPATPVAEPTPLPAAPAAGRPTRRSPRAAVHETTPPARPAPRPAPRRRWPVIGAFAAVVVLAVSALVYGGSEGEADARPAGDPRVAALVVEAETALGDDRLTTPEGNSALDHVEEILAIDPENDEARQLRERIVVQYETWGDEKREAGRYAEALDYYAQAMDVAQDTSAALLAKQVEVLEALEAARAAEASPPDPGNPGNPGNGKPKKKKRGRIGW